MTHKSTVGQPLVNRWSTRTHRWPLWPRGPSVGSRSTLLATNGLLGHQGTLMAHSQPLAKRWSAVGQQHQWPLWPREHSFGSRSTRLATIGPVGHHGMAPPAPNPPAGPQTHLQDPEGALVAHADQAAQRQLQHHGTFEGDEIPDVLQQEEARAVIIAVTAPGWEGLGGGDTNIYEGSTGISGPKPPSRRPPSLYLRKETTREFLNLE